MARPFAPVYFADENALGCAKLMRRAGRSDIYHPGQESLPEVPLGAADLDWMPIIGARRWILISRERRIRSRPAELAAFREHGICSVWIGGKRDLSPQDQVELFLRHEDRLVREIIKRGHGPWALAMSPSGLRPLLLRQVD